MFSVGQQLERNDLCILNVKMNSVKREKLVSEKGRKSES